MPSSLRPSLDRLPAKSIRPIASLVVLALSLTAVVARASDGVIELNQACATQTGCAPGDDPGFPITLTARGSYRLTSDLEMPNANTNGIQVGADDVTLDFNGFTLFGPAFVPIDTHVCSLSTTGVGISPIAPTAPAALVVEHGRIRGMAKGISFPAADVRVERMTVERNCGDGVTLGTAALVVDSQFRANSGNGLVVGTGGRVRDSIADNNGDSGIFLGTGGLVTGCIATTNGEWGVNFDGKGGVASGNSLVGNQLDGVSFFQGGVATGNAASGNGWNGISAHEGAVVVGNSAHENHQTGIFSFPTTGIGLNATYANGGGGLGFGVQIACNVGDVGVATCP